MAGANTGILDAPFRGDGVIAAQRFVKLGAADDSQSCVQADTAGEGILGVAGAQVRTEHVGKATIAVQILGVAWLVAGDAVDAGKQVATDADGKAVEASGGDEVAGVALMAAAQADDLLTVLLTPGAEIAVGAAGS